MDLLSSLLGRGIPKEAKFLKRISIEHVLSRAYLMHYYETVEPSPESKYDPEKYDSFGDYMMEKTTDAFAKKLADVPPVAIFNVCMDLFCSMRKDVGVAAYRNNFTSESFENASERIQNEWMENLDDAILNYHNCVISIVDYLSASPYLKNEKGNALLPDQIDWGPIMEKWMNENPDHEYTKHFVESEGSTRPDWSKNEEQEEELTSGLEGMLSALFGETEVDKLVVDGNKLKEGVETELLNNEHMRVSVTKVTKKREKPEPHPKAKTKNPIKERKRRAAKKKADSGE